MREGVGDGGSVEEQPADDEPREREGGADGERDAAGDEAELELDGVHPGAAPGVCPFMPRHTQNLEKNIILLNL